MAHTRETRVAAAEIKFVVDPAIAPRIREWARTHLAADPHGLGPSGDEYETTSLYFDTDRFDVFHRRGSYGRAKYRVRRYNDGDVVFLERKLRQPRMLVKRRTLASLDALEKLQASSRAGEWSGDWFHRRLLARGLRPVCQVSYLRMARLLPCPEGTARLTLDGTLRTGATDVARFGGDGVEYLRDRLILELKYRAYVPALFRQLVEEFRLVPTPASKYRLAMAALGQVSIVPEERPYLLEVNPS